MAGAGYLDIFAQQKKTKRKRHAYVLKLQSWEVVVLQLDFAIVGGGHDISMWMPWWSGLRAINEYAVLPSKSSSRSLRYLSTTKKEVEMPDCLFDSSTIFL